MMDENELECFMCNAIYYPYLKLTNQMKTAPNAAYVTRVNEH